MGLTGFILGEGRTMGGGLLPVAVRDGRLVFLLGKEQRRPGVTKGAWSDFGGGREGKETPFQTAIREGAEELDGFLGVGGALRARVRDNMLATLRVRGFSTYMFLVPYDPFLPGYFNGSRAFTRKHLPDKIGRKGLFEKAEIGWFDESELWRAQAGDRDAPRALRPFYRQVASAILREAPRIRERLGLHV